MRLFHIIAAWLDHSPLARVWQLAKWRLKYLTGRVPDFATQIRQPHRLILRDVVLGLNPASVLEIGCGMGPNLFLLWQANHELTLAGMDPSRVAIESAGAEVLRHKASSIQLQVGAADQLRRLPESSVDVVLADAVLMYIPPDAISKTLVEMLRVSRSGVVLSTWHLDGLADKDLQSVPTAHYDEETWVYDYRRLLATISGIKLEISAYPTDVWQDARWKRYGAIVTIQHDL